MSSIDQQFVEYIVKSLVGNPDAVQIERRIDEKGVLLELTVDPEDLGRVIGKRGATAQSIRSLLRALGTKNDARYNLKIVDNGFVNHDRPSYPPREEARETELKEPVLDDEQLDEEIVEAIVEEEGPAKKPSHSSVVSNTRKELEELDDLDV
ncbi:MAG: KH domain-containing protein [Candidatus Saccharibacteria bacterium]